MKREKGVAKENLSFLVTELIREAREEKEKLVKKAA